VFKGLDTSLHSVRFGLLEEGDQLLHLVRVDFGFFLVLRGLLGGKVALEDDCVEGDPNG